MSAQVFAFEFSGTTFELARGENEIGRAASCTVTLEADGVDERHAVAVVDENGVVLRTRPDSEDLRVNGKPSRVEDLKPGDRLRFGTVECGVEEGEGGLKLVGEGISHQLRSGENTIGRDAEMALTLDDDSISRHHASILVLPSGRVRVRDLSSSNGTFVNGQRLGELSLSNGDKVEIGEARLVLLAVGAPQGTRADTEPLDREAAAPAAAGATRLISDADMPSTPAAPAPRAAEPKFEILLDGESRPLAPGTYTIGRAPDCEFQITDDEKVSRHHARLTVSEEKVLVQDLESSNGTMLNGAKFRGEFQLKNGDTILVGSKELRFKTDEPVDFMGKTVLAQDVLSSLGATVLASDMPGPEVIRSLDLLELDLDATPQQIQARFQELYSDFQLRSTNAPTPELREKYEQKLRELKKAAEELIPEYASAEDLPAAEPVDKPLGGGTVGASTAPSPPAEPAPAASQAPTPSSGAAPTAPPAAREKKVKKKAPKSASGGAGVPKSTFTMAAMGTAAAVASAVLFMLYGKAAAVEGDLEAELQRSQQAIADMEVAIPETQLEIEGLEEGRATLLENTEFKLCNLSSRDLIVTWLHATHVNENGALQSFDSAFQGYPEWPVPPGGTGKFTWVVDDDVVWNGSAIFFSVLLDYRGREVFRSGSTIPLGGDCYNLKLD